MPSDKDKMTIEVSFLVNKELDQKLCEMVDAYEGSKSAMLRGIVRAAHKMRIEERPTCANGGDCRAPQCFMSFGIPPARQPEDRPDPDTNRQLAGHAQEDPG